MKSFLLAAPAALALLAAPAFADAGSAAAPSFTAEDCSKPIIEAIDAARKSTTGEGGNTAAGKGKGAFANALRSFSAAEKEVKAGCAFAAKHPKGKQPKIQPLKPEANAKDDACSTPMIEKINAAIQAMHDSPHNGLAGGKFGNAMRDLTHARAEVRKGCRAAEKAPAGKHGKGSDAAAATGSDAAPAAPAAEAPAAPAAGSGSGS